LAAAEGFLRGIERRIASGLKANVGSVASVFISRWDAAIKDKVPAKLQNRLGIAMASRTYDAARTLLSSPRWERIYSAGAWPQRLVWASTGVKDPTAPDVLYVKALASPFTINTMPEGTLRALSEQTELGSIMAADGVSCEEVLAELTDVGIDIDTLADRLQEEGAKSFAKSWDSLMAVIASKREPGAKAA
jgi:transaldolase